MNPECQTTIQVHHKTVLMHSKAKLPVVRYRTSNVSQHVSQ